MIRHGEPPYLECSSRGDRRFSALFARLIRYDMRTIEDLYQSAKVFDRTTPGVGPDGHILNWRDAKGKTPINLVEVGVLYHNLWRWYLEENPHLIQILLDASGLSDMFGQPNHQNQATTLWTLRNKYFLDGHF